MAALATRMATILSPHTVVEEEGLFPALAGEFPDQVAALHAEHRRIETVLGEAAAGPPADPMWPARLTETLELLREHILKEQDGVFPAALSSLSPAQWDAVDDVRSRAGSLPAQSGPLALAEPIVLSNDLLRASGISVPDPAAM